MILALAGERNHNRQVSTDFKIISNEIESLAPFLQEFAQNYR